MAKLKKSEIIQKCCTRNIKKYLKETTLHGLKYLADNSLTIWEKLFFISSFIAALITVVNLISNVYVKWDSTPVIIGISPHPTSILKIPFPAITLCNMNQFISSKVSNYSKDSMEYGILRYLCSSEADYDRLSPTLANIQNNSLDIAEFIIKHSQPCARFLLVCEISSIAYNCSDLFHEVITDEGVCCVFNTLHPDFLYNGKYNIINNIDIKKGTEAVNWNPENGYPTKLPERYYPRPAAGSGVSMGVSVIVNAELDEYYCSSTNGAGIKMSLHNPIETPSVKESGLTLPLGHETRFRINTAREEAVPAIRSIHRSRRLCLFQNEERLLFFTYYTRRNCELECRTDFVYHECKCIPYINPMIYDNATTCTIKESFCILRANLKWSRITATSPCLKRCLPSCYDLNFLPNSFSSPLAKRNFIIQNRLLQNMSKKELSKNIAVLHFFYRETVFHGNLKNVYIGTTEFLSNIGGIMGLFMGFSIISIAEIVYFSILRPIFKFVLPRKYRSSKRNNNISNRADNKIDPNWLSEEIFKNQTS